MAREAAAPQASILAARPSFRRPDAVVLLALVPATIIVGLLLLTVYISVRATVADPTLTLEHYATLFVEPLAIEAALNTVVFALVTVAVAMTVGVPVAWLVERTDLPGKRVIYGFMTIGILIPGFFTAMGWLFFAHPRIGTLNLWLMDAFGLAQAPFPVNTIPAMGFIQGLGLAALVFVMTSASIRAMDSSLEEAAQTAGAGLLATLRRVTLPLAWPSLLAALLYVLTIGISAFDIPLIIGVSNRIFVFSTYLFTKAFPSGGLPEYGISAAFSTFMIGLAILLSFAYSRMLGQARKYQVISGKSYRPKLIVLGPWKVVAWAFVGTHITLALLMPLFMLVWMSFQPFIRPPSLEALATLTTRNYTTLQWELVQRAATNTAILMIAAPTLALVMSLITSWVVLRTRSRFRLAFDYIAFLPHAVPHVVFGLAAVATALFILGWTNLYGSLTLLVIVLAIAQLSFGTRIANSALIQIHNDLEDAAYVAGAGTFATMRRVVVPLLRPAFVFGWLWLALLAFRELTLSQMLFSKDSITMAQLVSALVRGAGHNQAAALAVLMMGALLPLVALYWRFAGGRQLGDPR